MADHLAFYPFEADSCKRPSLFFPPLRMVEILVSGPTLSNQNFHFIDFPVPWTWIMKLKNWFSYPL